MKEKLENIWYYYKKPILFALFMVLLIAYPTVQCAKSSKSDFDIFCLHAGLNDYTAFKAKAESIVGDINGDGKSIVLCETLTATNEITPEGSNLAIDKLTLSFTGGEHRMYIMDKEFFENPNYSEGFENLRAILPAESLEGGLEYEGKIIAIPADNCPCLKSDASINCENLYVGIPDDTIALAFGKQKNADVLRDASKRLLLEMIKTGEN